MIPTSIDGTDITGATIDGNDVQEITVDGDVVFNAAPPVTIIDDFETNLSVWTGDTSQFSLVNNSRVGNNAVQANASIIRIVTSTGKQAVPSTGDTHQIWINTDDRSITSMGVQYAHTNSSSTYRVLAEFSQSEFRFDTGGGGGSVLHDVSVNYPTGWILIRMFHDTNGSYSHQLFDTNLNQIVSISGNDTTHISNGEFDTDDVALTAFNNDNARYDHWVIL